MIQYTFSAGESFDLMSAGLPRMKEANFHSFAWVPEVTERQFGERIDRWTKEALVMTAVLMFAGTPSKRQEQLNAFHAAIDGDFFRNAAGVLTWQDSYIKCFIRSSSTSPSEGNTRTINEIEIYCPNPFWIQEQVLEIDPVDDSVVVVTDKGYETERYGYPYSYSRVATIPKMMIDHYAPCHFRLEAFGPATGISINIGGHAYVVSHAVSDGERLIIDSRPDQPADRHCYLIGRTGIITNCFNDRDPSGTLLEKIRPGENVISYARTYKIRLTVFKERSEPAWTS